MRLNEIYNQNNQNTVISLEVFPPKEPDKNTKIDKLLDELEILKQYNPQLISVTYGAGGSNAETSFEIVKLLKTKTNAQIMPHYTCVCSNKKQIESYLTALKKEKIQNILALRGDIPDGYDTANQSFKYANELIEYIKQNTDFSVAVAGYTEGHNDAPNLEYDIKNLKKKIYAGGEAIFTQLFFDNNYFFKYRDILHAQNINIPIIAGILPIISYTQIERITKLCKVTLPKKLQENLQKYKDDNNAISQIGIEFASNQVKDLIQTGVKGIHFYCLNKANATKQILDNIL